MPNAVCFSVMGPSQCVMPSLHTLKTHVLEALGVTQPTPFLMGCQRPDTDRRTPKRAVVAPHSHLLLLMPTGGIFFSSVVSVCVSVCVRARERGESEI